GPFTQDLYLERYETVILIAKGLGIMGVLPLALSLTHRRIHDMKKKESAALSDDLTRKVALFWWIDQYEPNQRLLDHLNDLQLLDSNNVNSHPRKEL
ncbi:hypothetical protein F5883DRAFT_435732, partial [Diaporthe sp. PMI_573]